MGCWFASVISARNVGGATVRTTFTSDAGCAKKTSDGAAGGALVVPNVLMNATTCQRCKSVRRVFQAGMAVVAIPFVTHQYNSPSVCCGAWTVRSAGLGLRFAAAGPLPLPDSP